MAGVCQKCGDTISCLYCDVTFAANEIGTNAAQPNNSRIMPCLMYAGVNEQCDVFGDGRCGSVACNLART